jgi:hypothetical protein
MASPSGVVFPASISDLLTDPVDFCFGSMAVEPIDLATCLVIKNTAVTSTQQVESDMLAETHPSTPRDLIAGLDRVKGMLSNMIKVCKSVKCPRRTTPPPPDMPLGLRNTAHTASCHMKKKIQIESGSNTSSHGNRRGPLDNPYPVHENSKHTTRQCCVLKKLRRPPTATHGRQINRAPSPERGTFQIAHVVVFPTILATCLKCQSRGPHCL